MKLHLPKQLFTALLAAITLAAPATLTLGSAAWGATGWAGRNGLSGTGLYIGGTSTTGVNRDGIPFVTESTPSDGVLTTFVEKVDVAAGKPSLTEFYIVADKNNNEGVNAEIRELIVNSGTTIGVDVSGWGPGRVFSDLKIEKLTIGTEAVPGTAVLNVSANHCVTVGDTTGTLSSVNNAGTLTIGTAADAAAGIDASTTALGGSIVNSGTLTLNGAFTAASFDGFATTTYASSLSNTTHGYAVLKTATVIASGGTIETSSDFSFTLGGTNITNSLVHTDGGNVMYYIAEDAASTTSTIYEITSAYTTAVEYNATSGDTAGATGFKLGNGTTVKLTGSDYSKLTGGITIAAGNDGSATVSIANGVSQTYASLGLGSLVTKESGSYVLNIDGTGTVVTTNHTGGTGFHTAGEISITNEGKLSLNNKDTLGWGGSATSKISILNGTLAIGGRQTCSTVINMLGGAVIQAAENPLTGGDAPMIQVHSAMTWDVSGTGNVVKSDVKFRMNNTLNLNVANGGELSIKGEFDGSSQLTKSGEGKLVLDGVAKTINGQLQMTGGTLQLGGTTASDGLVTLAGGINHTAGTVQVAGEAAITGDLVLGGALVVSGGRADVTGALTVSGTEARLSQSGEGVLNLSGDITINAEAGATFSGQVGIGSTITNNGTLTLNDSINIIGELSAFTQRGEATVSYQLADETSSENNGFRVTSGASYWLTSEGSTGTTNVAEGITTVQHGDNSYKLNQDDGGEGEGSTNNWYFQVESNVGKVYYVTSGDVVVDNTVQTAATGGYVLQGGTMNITEGSVNTSLIEYTSGSVTLASGARLTLDVADNSTTATHWLTDTLGVAGSVIEIAANANFGEVAESPTPYSTAFGGKWVVTNGATLKLGGLDSGWSQDYSVDLQKLEALELDGGNLRYFGGNSTLSAVNVKQAGTLTVYEMYNDDKLLTINDLNLTANLTLDTTWRSRLDIESLSGAGNLIINNSSKASSGGNGVVVDVNAADDFTGYLDINCGTHSKDAVNISTDANATVRILGDSNITISSLTLLEGAKLALDTKGTGSNNQAYSYNLKSVAVSDSATIETTQQHGGWQAEINIGSLTGSGSLSIESNAKTSQRSIINLEGGDFDGILKVTGSSSSSDRKLALNVKDADALADAVVELHGNSSHVALAIGGDAGNSVTIKGIDDRRDANGTSIATGTMSIVSGSQSYGVADNFSSDGQVRTLVIDTDGSDNAASVNSTTSAALGSYLNLQKKGVGSQTFNGNVGAFNGALDVQGGTLAFTGSGNMTATSVSVADGANLTLGGTAGLILAGGTAEAPATYSMGSLTSAGNTITVSEHAALSTLSNLSGTVTLAGSGLYELQDGAITMTRGVSLSGNWTGTVKMSNVAYDGSQTNNNKMETMASTAGSGKLMLTNVNGWLGTGTMSKHMILENGTEGEAALYLSNGSSQNNSTKTAIFSGGISGTGDIQFNWNKTGVSNCTLAHTISGDTASWSGKFISNESGSLDVQVDFTKGGEVFSSTVDGGGVENRTDNKLTVNVGSSDAATSFNGSIGKTSGAGAVELNVTHNNVTFNKAVNVDKLTVAQGASAQLGNTMTVGGVSFSASESATAESPAKLLANGSSALARLQEDASFTIEDMTLTNTTVTAATPTTQVKLQNVEGSTALLAKGAFTLHATPTVGMSPTAENHGTLSYTNGLAIATDASATLTLNLDVVNAVASDAHGTYDLTITLSGFGEGFAVTQDILDMVGFDSTSWLGQALVSQKAEYTVVTEQTPATAGEGGVPTVSYAAGTGANVGSLVITISGLNVPEPATSTLSLLALAALAARRRRK